VQLAGLSYDEALRVLRELHELSEQHQIVVIGGQAVALWYRQLSSLGYLPGDELAPLTSKDIDFRATRQTVARAAELLGGEARLPTIDDHTPSTGLILFLDSDGQTRQIDFVDAPYGLKADDVVATAQHILLADAQGDVPAVLIHPQRLVESRVYNIIGLKQDSPHALRQARAAIACAGAFSRFILDAEDPDQRTRARAVLKLNERIYRFCLRGPARQFVRQTGMDPFDAIVNDHPALPEKFRTLRFPQMKARLAHASEPTAESRDDQRA
jgi:hypothetical protein